MKLIVSTFLVYKVKKCLLKSGKVIVYIFQLFFILPKLWFSVWALVARLVIPRCPSLVHQLPITCSPRDRLMSMVGTCSFLYLVDYIVSYSYCKLTIIFSIPNSTCQSSILFLVSIYILHSSS